MKLETENAKALRKEVLMVVEMSKVLEVININIMKKSYNVTPGHKMCLGNIKGHKSHINWKHIHL